MRSTIIKTKLILIFILCLALLFSQTDFNPDQLFQKARETAFSGQPEQAIELCQKILKYYPEYYDVRVFLARIYAWQEDYQKARREVNKVLEQDADNAAANRTIVDIEYWSQNHKQALAWTLQGLQHYPNDENLLYKKALLLNILDKPDQAAIVLNNLLQINPSHEKGLKLLEKLEESRKISQIKLRFRHDTFERTDDKWGVGICESERDPWQFYEFDYSRRLDWGKLSGSINYASRFGKEGVQLEMDAYPRIRQGTYSYLSLGYSAAEIFPQLRAGAEIFQSLPIAYEASLGWRYMQYSNTNLNIFTFSFGKYYKQFWLNFRSFLSPEDVSFSSSWFLNIRRYFSSPEDYLQFMLGYGTSPDNNLAEKQVQYLSSKSFMLGGQHTLTSFFILEWKLRLENDEIRAKQFQKNCSYELGFSYSF